MEYLIGLALPPLIEVLNKDVKNEDERLLVAFVVCVLVAIITHIQQLASVDTHSFMSITGYLGIIFTESELVFKKYWKNSDLRDKLQATIGSVNQPPAQG